MNATSMHIRVPKELKKAAQEIIEANGLDLTSAIRLYFLHIASKGTIPLAFLRSEELPERLRKELKLLTRDRKNIVGPFKNSKDLMKSLHDR